MKEMSQYGLHFWPAVAFIVLHTIANPTLGQQMTLDDNVKRQWKQCETLSRSLQGTARIKSVFSNGKTRIQTYYWKQNQECALGRQVSTDFPYESITLENPAYRSKLRRDSLNPAKVILSSIERFKDKDRALSRVDSFKLFYSVAPHFGYWEVPLSELVSQPAFQIKEISKDIEGDHELIRINYSSVMEKPEHRMRYQRQGMIYLDPSRCWCIRQIKETELSYHDSVLHRTAEWDIRYETTDHPSGFPLLQTDTTKYKGIYERDKRKVEGTINSEYEWEVNDHVPTSEFTLSTFGLPEPGVARQPRRWYLWVALAGFVCLGLAALFRWKARRKERPSENPQS